MTVRNVRPTFPVSDTGVKLNKHLEHQLGEFEGTRLSVDSSSSRGPAFVDGVVWSICGGVLWMFAVHLASLIL